jgi:hypothetical protein
VKKACYLFRRTKNTIAMETPIRWKKTQLIVWLLKATISERQKHYRSIDYALDFFDSDSESDDDFDAM